MLTSLPPRQPPGRLRPPALPSSAPARPDGPQQHAPPQTPPLHRVGITVNPPGVKQCLQPFRALDLAVAREEAKQRRHALLFQSIQAAAEDMTWRCVEVDLPPGRGAQPPSSAAAMRLPTLLLKSQQLTDILAQLEGRSPVATRCYRCALACCCYQAPAAATRADPPSGGGAGPPRAATAVQRSRSSTGMSPAQASMRSTRLPAASARCA